MERLTENLSNVTGQTLGLVLLLSTIFIFLFKQVQSYRRLSHFPGPRGTGLSKLWMLRSTMSGRLYLNLAEACKEYGSLTRIGPKDLVTDDVEIIRRMNAIRSPYIRSEWYNSTAVSHDVNHVFCERDEARHAERRSKLIPAYSGRDIDGLEKQLDNRIIDLCNLIKQKYTSSGFKAMYKPVDLARLSTFFSLDVIHTIALGQPMGFLRTDADVHGFLADQAKMLPIFEWLSTFPALEQLLRTRWISAMLMPKPTDNHGFGYLLGFTQKIVASRRHQKNKDMVGSFLEHGLSDREAEMEVLLEIIGGADTTATAIRMTLFFISSNPKVYSKLQKEIDKADKSSKLSLPVIQYEETQQMSYLEACIKEGLRMHPPVVGLMSKQVPQGGDNLNGRFVPGGTNIGYCAWSIHRSPHVFGVDAEVYSPERWLNADETKLSAMNRSADLGFGWGKNGCLGKAIAWMKMRKIIAEVLRRYDITIVNPEKPFNSANRNGLFVQDSMFVLFEERVKE